MVFACNVSLTKSKGDKQLFWRNKVYKKGTLVGTFYKEKSNEQKMNRNVSSLVKSSDERESAALISQAKFYSCFAGLWNTHGLGNR